MSTHIVGIIPPDAKWLRMKTVYDTCTAADVPVPLVVLDFFNHEKPDPLGVVVALEAGNPAVKAFNDKVNAEEGFEVDIKQLSPDVRFIRFTNSW